MKKIFGILVVLSIFIGISVQQTFAWNFNNGAVGILNAVKDEANKDVSNEIQNTDLDVVTSKASECDGIAPDPRFTITRTLCSIKANMKDYVQYFVFFGLSAAVIFLIWNGFKIVIASDREKQVGIFIKNLKYIVIGVVFLTGFYYIIDIFVSIVNLVVE